ncbi:D-serine dehydratase [Fulvia fulva]|nr:D-serine dehydratase [Fulvia fulva]
MATTQASTFRAASLYPSPSEASLKLHFLGQKIKDVQAPAAIVNAAVVRRNCRLMLETAEKLGVSFRAHVKTHKTTEISELQVGKDTKSVKLVASTVSEIEHLTPYLLKRKVRGDDVNVLYGLPLPPSAVPRLAAIARILGKGTVGLFADHPAHIKVLAEIPVWVNIDVGYHREGVPAGSKQLADIAYALAASPKVTLGGIYTHYGLSYDVSSPEEALESMAKELRGLEEGAVAFLKSAGANISSKRNASKVVLSLGATPTTTSIQNLLEGTKIGSRYRDMIKMCAESFEVEFHGGVYPVMDMQQLATRARPQHSANDPGQSLLSFKDLGFRVLAEVASVYPDRSDTPEALIAAGSIVLGREPCKSYPGWGVITPWPAQDGPHYEPEGSKTGWIVGKVSQEHGNLRWEGPQDNVRPLEVGEKVLVWPNHACIAGVNFGWYLVVDSESDPETIVDVWVRWRGW